MDMNALRKERTQLFKDAIRKEKKLPRVPHFGNIFSWKIYDAGYPMSIALNDYSIMEKVIRHTFETYKLDVLYEMGWRNPIQVTSALGNTEYVINDEANSINIKDQCFMEANDYPMLIENPKKYLWETFLPRKYKLLQNKNNSEDFRNLLRKFGEFGQFMGMTGKLCEEYGIADFSDPNGAITNFGFGYEFLFNNLRGIKELSYDIRRDSAKVISAIEALDQTFVIPRFERAKNQPGTNENFCVDIDPVLLGHTILSRSQFEKFYWPHFKRMIEMAQDYGKLIFIFAEGDSRRFYDFFQELPNGHFAILPEQDDVFEMKKALPNITVAGGMPVDLLGKSTPALCLDYAKKLIDELAYDGGYIFSENKMMSFKYDCKRENLKAVCDFIADYK